MQFSNFRDNRSLGGDENVVLLDPVEIPRADGPNNAYGGAILAFNGAMNLNFVQVRQNEAIAGDDYAAADRLGKFQDCR